MIEAILAAIKLGGSHLPAFKSLFDSVVGTLGEQDQATLKAAYAEHMKRSDDLHRDVQNM